MAFQAFLFTGYALVMNGPELYDSDLCRDPATVDDDRNPGTRPLLGEADLREHHCGRRGTLQFAKVRKDSVLPGSGQLGFSSHPRHQVYRLAGLASPLFVPPIFIGIWSYLLLRGLDQ